MDENKKRQGDEPDGSQHQQRGTVMCMAQANVLLGPQNTHLTGGSIVVLILSTSPSFLDEPSPLLESDVILLLAHHVVLSLLQ